jgi:hypothetical protein
MATNWLVLTGSVGTSVVELAGPLDRSLDPSQFVQGVLVGLGLGALISTVRWLRRVLIGGGYGD